MKRTYCMVAAIIGWLAIGIQLGVNIDLSDERGLTHLGSVWRFLGYFTILTNIVVATSYSVKLAIPESFLGRFLDRPEVDSGVLMAICTVGLIYAVVLQSLWDPQGAQLVGDVLLHYVVPLGYLAYWAIFVPRGILRWSFVFGWLIYPLGYLLYALVRGAFDGWYPYPFIDVTSLGYGGVLLSVGALATLFLLAGLLIVVVDKAAAHLIPRPVVQPQVDRLPS